MQENPPETAEGAAVDVVRILPESLPDPLAEALVYEVAGSSVLQWTIAAVVFLLVFVVLRVLRGQFARRLRRLAERSETDVDDLVARIIERTRGLFLFVVALVAASVVLTLPPGVQRVVERVFALAVFLQAGFWGTHLVDYVIQRQVRRRTAGAGSAAEEAPRVAVLGLFHFFGRVAVWSVVLLAILDNLGIDVTAAVAGLGIGGIAVGLALQSVLQDTFASLAIVLDKPFEVGDFIVVGDLMGTVERVGVKTTRLRSLGGEQLVFGNGDLLSSRIRNYKRMAERRVVFNFGLVRDAPADLLEEVPRFLRRTIEALPDVRFDRAHFKSLGEWALDFEVVYYVRSAEFNVYMDLQQRINLALLRWLRDTGLALAYPTRTVLRPDEPTETATTPASGAAS